MTKYHKLIFLNILALGLFFCILLFWQNDNHRKWNKNLEQLEEISNQAGKNIEKVRYSKDEIEEVIKHLQQGQSSLDSLNHQLERLELEDRIYMQQLTKELEEANRKLKRLQIEIQNLPEAHTL